VVEIRTGMQKPLKHAKNIKISAPWLISLGYAGLNVSTSAAHTAQELFPDEGIILLETSMAPMA